MINKIVGLITIIFLLFIWGSGCSVNESPQVSDDNLVIDYTSLVNNLRAEGVTVESAGEINQDFFSVSGRVIEVKGEQIQVFEYIDQSSAEADASLVSPDGGSIGTTIPFWIAPPHFYKAGKLVVLYVGENAEVMDVLEAVLGAQFAGRD